MLLDYDHVNVNVNVNVNAIYIIERTRTELLSEKPVTQSRPSAAGKQGLCYTPDVGRSLRCRAVKTT